MRKTKSLLLILFMLSTYNFVEAQNIRVLPPSTSNLSGMIKTKAGESSYVNNIVQRCKVELDEYGTEAAAVTAITVGTNSVQTESDKKTKKIDLNRPFVFMIYDETNEQILFMGKIVTIE